MQPAAQIALTHHERRDGSGYPNRLAGNVSAFMELDPTELVELPENAGCVSADEPRL